MNILLTAALDLLTRRIEKFWSPERAPMMIPRKSMRDHSILSNCLGSKSQGALSRSDDEDDLIKRMTMRE